MNFTCDWQQKTNIMKFVNLQMIFIKDFVMLHLTILLGGSTLQLAGFKLASFPKHTKGTKRNALIFTK